MTMGPKLRCCSVSGIKIEVGDVSLGFGKVVKVVQQQHELGARYVDVTFDTGETHQCWAGFKYHIVGGAFDMERFFQRGG